MNEIEWCRVNAPKEFQSLNDVELLRYMHEPYVDFMSTLEARREKYKHNEEIYCVLRVLIVGVGCVSLSDSDAPVSSTALRLTKVCNKLFEDDHITEYSIKRVDNKEGVLCSVEMSMGGLIKLTINVSNITNYSYVSKVETSIVMKDIINQVIARRLANLTNRYLSNVSPELLELCYLIHCFDFDERSVMNYLRKSYTEQVFEDVQSITEKDLRGCKTAYDSFDFNRYYQTVDTLVPDFELVVKYINNMLVHSKEYLKNKDSIWNAKLWQYKEEMKSDSRDEAGCEE